MNIFVTDPCPIQSARNLPDKHIVKMPLETCQMLSIIYSDWYYGVGKLYKSDGKPYRTAHGAFRNHPCTQWAATNQYNLAWLICHGLALCKEYTLRYNKIHTCQDVLLQAKRIYARCFDVPIDTAAVVCMHDNNFTRAMPESIKFDTTIDTITAYKQYLNTKPWLASNYLRIPSRKPSFITTMTQSKPVFDFSTTPEQRAAEQAKQDAAIASAKAAAEKMYQEAGKVLNNPKKKDAPAVAKAKQGLVPAKKATKKSGKAGRVVGISADENKFLKELLDLYNNKEMDYNAFIESNKAAYDKLISRYN